MATIIYKIAKRVNEILTAYKNAQREFNSPVIKQLVPSLATAVAVAALEAMNILKGGMEDHDIPRPLHLCQVYSQ